MNQSERYVFSLVRRSSLTLWSYANPLNGATGKELCDVLINFGPNIAILSVKDIHLKSTSKVELGRWQRRAIEESAKQIYGAERWIRSATHVVRTDGTLGLSLPPSQEMNIHRIAVALGSKGKAPIPSGDFGKGIVHVFDEKAFDIVLGELDTPADLFTYLSQKIAFTTVASHVLLEGGEEDMLAMYLANDRSFPEATGVVSIGSGIWDDFLSLPEYKAKREANKASAAWDGLIESVARDALAGRLEFGGSLSDTEKGLRQMAAENRYQRRVLGQAFTDFLDQSTSNLRSRLATSNSGTTYVFLATPHGTDRQDRGIELAARCFVARGRVRENATVVGIATEQYIKGRGSSVDVFCMFKPEWTLEDEKALEELTSTAPYFQGEMRRAFDQPEYPQ